VSQKNVAITKAMATWWSRLDSYILRFLRGIPFFQREVSKKGTFSTCFALITDEFSKCFPFRILLRIFSVVIAAIKV